MGLCSVFRHDYIPYLCAVCYTQQTHRQQLIALTLAAAFIAPPTRKLFSEPDPYIFFPFFPHVSIATRFFQPMFSLFKPLFFSTPLCRTRIYMCPSFSPSPPSSKARLCLSALTTNPALLSIPHPPANPARCNTTAPHPNPLRQPISISPLTTPKSGRSSITTYPLLQGRLVPFSAETPTSPFSGSLTGVHHILPFLLQATNYLKYYESHWWGALIGSMIHGLEYRLSPTQKL